jgi:ferredoxin-type protein NapG
VQAIRLLESDDPRLSGTPFIDPQMQACVVCEDLACMKVCPTGALQSVPRHLIHIGVAEVRQDVCVRKHGDDCRLCVEKCPIGATAIHLAEGSGEVVVREEGCVGCGVCEMYCPTEPRAIVIKAS